MAIFSNKLKKCFWPILGPFSFPILGAKKNFQENPTLSHSVTHNFTWDSNATPNFRKN